MPGKLRARFWIEASLSLVAAMLFLVTLVSREWIELLFGINPDGGSGALEWGIVAVCLLAAVMFSGLARSEFKRRVLVSV